MKNGNQTEIQSAVTVKVLTGHIRLSTSFGVSNYCSVTENSRSLATRMVFNTVFLRPLTYPRFPRESLNRPTLLKITFQATAAL